MLNRSFGARRHRRFQGCKSTGCKSGQCCSYWGYCGSTTDYCGSGKYQCVCDCKGKNPCKGSSSSGSKTNKSTSSSVRYVTASSLNIRKGPSTNYGTAGSYSRCQKVTVVSTSNGWAKLSTGKYVSAQYLSKTNPCGSSGKTNGKNC